MHEREQRIADLHQLIGILQTALQETVDPHARGWIYACLNACLLEYIELGEQRPPPIASADEPLRERSHGETDSQ
jgi:hypothetical protein